MAKIILKPGREKSILKRHPWIFSGAIQRVEGDPQPGETVEVVTCQGNSLAQAGYSPHSQIRARVWSFDPKEAITPGFFMGRLEQALRLRNRLIDGERVNACRLVYAESDGLPGIIVDRYNEFIVCQFLTMASEVWKSRFTEVIKDLIPCRGIYERSDADIRQKEGLKPSTGILWGEAPPDLVDVVEYGCRFFVDIRGGHKTGFYLDQRQNRQIIGSFASGGRVLNAFSYTGGFGVAALAAQASYVVNVDTSSDALQLARKNFEQNRFNASRFDLIQADVFEQLRLYHKIGERFDLIILDPPKFAESKNHLQKAVRGYKDINRLALGLLKSGGFLATFSCSGLMDAPLFQKTVAYAALDANKQVRILHSLHQSFDHPVAVNFPESAYLKGLICQVI